jgi:outer membrane receptor protein involved in Fe transport
MFAALLNICPTHEARAPEGGIMRDLRVVVASSMAITMALLSSPAVAQSQPTTAEEASASTDNTPDKGGLLTSVAPTDEASTGKDTIVVTGSRIKRAGYDTLEPATVVSKEYLEARGLTNVADALNEMPSFAPGVNPTGNQSSFGVGQNFVNRFGLGSNRTLTLVNGRRFVSTNAPSIFGNTPGLQVDLNVIPTQLVERIENIAIGGAPVYGSDAIAGVVNVILKKNYQGIGVQALGGITSRGDNGRYNASIIAGKNFGPDDRGNITVSASYDQVNGVLGASRKYFRDGITTGTNPTAGSANTRIPGRTSVNDGRVSTGVPYNTNNTDGIPSTVYIRNGRIFSLTGGGLLLPSTGSTINATYGYPAGFGANNTLLQFNPSGNLVSFNPGIPFGTQNSSGGDGFDLVGTTSQITSSIKRFTTNLMAHYELTDHLNLFVEGTYYNAKGRELIDQSIYNATLFGGLSAPLRFQSNDPRLTDQARAQLAALGVTSFRLSRASTDLVNNNARSTTQVYRGVIGLEGDFEALGRKFNWEATANYGRTVGDFYQTVLNQQNFVNAINVTRNAAGQIVCNVAGVTAANNVAPNTVLPVADAACVPLDVFGYNRSSQAARNYVTAQTHARSIIEQQVYNINIGSSSLVHLWSGDVGVNIGYEHRNEKAEFSPDAFQLAGLGRAVPIGGNKGQYNTDEGTAELLVPLVAPENHVPLVHSIVAEGRARYVNNSINGTFWAYTYGGRYQPIPDIEFRGNYTRSLRSPSVVEAFTPTSPAFNTFPDPCDRTLISSGTNPTVRARNCAAFYAAYGINGSTFDSQARVATVPVTSGGNQNLKNEVGNSYTFGVVLRPRFLKRFTAAVDWNRIYIRNNITSLTPANIAEGCYDNPNFNTSDVDNANSYCSLIHRDRSSDAQRNGQLSNNANNPAIVGTYVNGAFIKLKALTANVDYYAPLDGIGLADTTVNFSGSFYYLNKWKSSNNGVTVNNSKGTLGLPIYSGQFNVGLVHKAVSLNFQGQYQGKQLLDRTFTVENRDILGVGAYWLFNMSAGVNVNKETSMRVAVSNLFDRDPPFPLTTNGLGIYDYLGRRFTVSFQTHF